MWVYHELCCLQHTQLFIMNFHYHMKELFGHHDIPVSKEEWILYKKFHENVQEWKEIIWPHLEIFRGWHFTPWHRPGWPPPPSLSLSGHFPTRGGAGGDQVVSVSCVTRHTSHVTRHTESLEREIPWDQTQGKWTNKTRLTEIVGRK